jgi:Flp pilus assembly pilin Flp
VSNVAGAAPIAVDHNPTMPRVANTQNARTKSRQKDTEAAEMIYLTKWYVRAREDELGQTMTEYVLIIAAVALVALIAYKALGNAITNEISSVTANLGG